MLQIDFFPTKLPKENNRELMDCCLLAMTTTFGVFFVIVNRYESFFGYKLVNFSLWQMLLATIISTYYSVKAYKLALNNNDQKSSEVNKEKSYMLLFRVGIYPSIVYFLMLVGGITILGEFRLENPHSDMGIAMFPGVVAMASTYNAYFLGYNQSQMKRDVV